MSGTIVREIGFQSALSEIGIRLDIEQGAPAAVSGSDVSVVVELERHANQRRDRIGQLLPQVLVGVLGLRQRRTARHRHDHAKTECFHFLTGSALATL